MRAYCQKPDSCVAGKRGACSLCHRGVLAKNAERMRRLHADPEFREKLTRAIKTRANILPPLTAEQRKVYSKLRPVVGRESALAEAVK